MKQLLILFTVLAILPWAHAHRRPKAVCTLETECYVIQKSCRLTDKTYGAIEASYNWRSRYYFLCLDQGGNAHQTQSFWSTPAVESFTSPNAFDAMADCKSSLDDLTLCPKGK